MGRKKPESHKSLIPGVCYRIVIVGSSDVGKSALTIRFMYNEFVEYYESTKVISYHKNILLDDTKIDVYIQDTTDQDNDLAVLDDCFRNGEGFLCVFSITDDHSFQATTEIRERILLMNDKYKHSGESIPFILVGSKGDLTKKRKVTVVEAESKAREWGVPYVETSALKLNNIEKVFLDLIRKVNNCKKDEKEESCSGQGKKKKNRKRIKQKCTIL